ncbi:copper amine oxidase N-terminal domain-containing protein [Tumebacillus permanentifrigoris]|uniref:Copper amine oxidase-like protein n=1 Tax=Tumebacillus permanentifrigoris TaxID=378543 RepID=A0A316DPH5_9BACL|nr:copper amine oxidase N-terminal domain-containing protein [Tumebacillus permanentifrigoris]PWK04981.1 copper amine oxidase-like protein [Tumebacillus permanentifrigoris]
MKNQVTALGSVLLMGAVLSSLPVSAQAAPVTATYQTNSFYFNGQYGFLDAGYVSLQYQNHLYVPARFVAEQMGHQVEWNDDTHTVIFKSGDGVAIPTDWSRWNSIRTNDDSVEVQTTPIHFLFDGNEKLLDSEYRALMYNDHVYVPVRFVAENLNANVQWMPNTSSVVISWAKGAENRLLKNFVRNHADTYIGAVQSVSLGNVNYLAVTTLNDGYTMPTSAYLIDGASRETNLHTQIDSINSTNVVKQGNQNLLLLSGISGAHTSQLELYGGSNGSPSRLLEYAGSNGVHYWLRDGKLNISTSSRTYKWDLGTPDAKDDSSINKLFEYDPSIQQMTMTDEHQNGVFQFDWTKESKIFQAYSSIIEIKELMTSSAIKEYPNNWTQEAKKSYVEHESTLSYLKDSTGVMNLETVKEDPEEVVYSYKYQNHDLQITLRLGSTWKITGFTVDGK